MHAERTRFARPLGTPFAFPAALPRSLSFVLERAGWVTPLAVLFALAVRLPYFA